MYTVKLYSNTGFNVENIPDSASLLGTAFVEKQAVDTVQNYVVTSVRISATFDDVKAVDYCQVGDFYYFVAGVTMSSRDVAILSLIPDYLTSFGISNLNFLDGITVRHHVDDDSFGLYTEDDPLLYCNEPLELEVGDPLFSSSSYDLSFVMSTVDLDKAGGGATLNAETYDDGQGNQVTVPHLPQLEPERDPTSGAIVTPTPTTTFVIPDTNGDLEFSINGSVLYPMYDNVNGTPNTPNETILKGMQYCRDIAAETAIIGCYKVPSVFIGAPTIAGNVSRLPAQPSVISCGIQYANPTMMPRNLRVLYGDYNRFGLITMSGNRMEVKPEEIYYAGAATNISPRVLCVADPRPDGRPYYRFEYNNKETPLMNNPAGTTLAELDMKRFWRNVIPGEQWYQIPLVFTTPSGIMIQQNAYNNSYQYNKRRFEKTDLGNAWGLTSAANDLIIGAGGQALGIPTRSSTMSPYDPNSGGNRYIRTTWSDPSIGGNFATTVGGIQSQTNNTGGFISAKVQKDIGQLDYTYNRFMNAREIGLAKNIVVPDVMFPYTNGTIRDYIGNGVIPYKYRPSDKDMELQDKLLTMYGYAVTDKLVNSHFFNRQYFNYVQANSVSIGNHIPQWWKAGIIAQLAGGVRVWHVTPDETHYDNNPIVVNP